MIDFFTSAPMLHLSFIIGMIGLFLAIQADNFQTIAKYEGAVNNRIAQGYNRAMKVMLINRFGAVLYFFLISYNIDGGLSSGKLIFGFSVTISLLVIPGVGIILWLINKGRKDNNYGSLSIGKCWTESLFWVTLISYCLNLMGLTLPWIAATIYPEMRLTLVNSSFIFNTLFSILNVYYIENKLARSIDARGNQVQSLVLSITFARLIAFSSFSVGFWLAALI